MKEIRIYTICIGLLFTVISCNSNSLDKDKKSFDVSLITKDSELQLSGEYEAVIQLNIDYLKKAGKMGYKEGEGLCYLNLAGVNVSAGNYEKALLFYKKAEDHLKNSENPYHKAAFYNDYSLYYSHLQLYDKSIECNDKALYYANKAKESELKNKLLPRIYVNKGIFFALKGWFGTSLKSFQKANLLENSAYSNCMVAQYYLFRHQPDSAGIYVSRADEKMQKQKTSDVESLWVYYTMGYYYNEINNYDKAEKALKKALEINIKTKDTYSSHIKDVYKSLSDLYKKKNDGDKAYYYLNKYTEEEGRLDEERFATVNKATNDFVSEMKKKSDWHKNDLPLLIALSISALIISGIYVKQRIKQMRLKKRTLKNQTEALKSHVRNTMTEEVIELAQKNDSSFLMKFKKIYPDFITALLKINPDLENSELAFCAMLKLHFSSKEIASYTFVQPRSVQQKKYRIRKRLNIEGEEDIYEFFDNLTDLKE